MSSTAAALGEENGGRPASVSNSTIPSEYRSVRPSTSGEPTACSGLMYSSVPTTKPLRVTRSSPALAIARGVAHLAKEAVGRYRDGELGVEHLDRDPPPGRVRGAENRRVPPPPNGGDHRVTVAQRLAHPLDQFASRHGLGSSSVLFGGRI